MAQEPPGFTTSRLQRGYTTTEVDAYLSSVFDLVAQGAPPPDIREAVFATKRGGYDMAEVDAFLEDLRWGIAGSDPPTTVSVEVADLPAPSFQTVRVGAAYQSAEVDAFIASIFAAVRERRPAPKIEQVSFRRAWRGGYAERDVDDYLDTLAAFLGQ